MVKENNLKIRTKKRLCEMFIFEPKTFVAEFHGIGEFVDHKGVQKSVLVRNVVHDGELVADHVWVRGDITDLRNFQKGDVVTFEAERYYYEKRPLTRKCSSTYFIDVGLIAISPFRKIERLLDCAN